MPLPAQPPKYANWAEMVKPIRPTDVCTWPVYALQRALMAGGYDPGAPDGFYGTKTGSAVKRYQADADLVVDGIVGPKTQASLLRFAYEKVESIRTHLPKGLLRGYAESEGASLLAATNWNGGGVDCGPVQIHLEAPYTQKEMQEAFGPIRAFDKCAVMILERAATYRKQRPSLTERRALELAVLAHNAPFLAEQFVRNGRLTTPNAPAQWVKKADGSYFTHAEWSVEYPKRIMKYVK